jgi:hypothetical protein
MDPLIGKYFSCYRERRGFREVVWSGQISDSVKFGWYLVNVIDALTAVLTGGVSFSKQIVVPVEEMRDWELFDSLEAWCDDYAEYNEIANKRDWLEPEAGR